VENTKSVTVTVKARRKVLAEIKKSHIMATADLREMQDASVPVRISISGFEGEYEEVSANPRNIQVKVENIIKKTFPITPMASGTPRAGYVVGTMSPMPKTVDISGPESLIKKISKVVAKVDVSEMSAAKRKKGVASTFLNQALGA
jgi:YbbR domain-containing protein